MANVVVDTKPNEVPVIPDDWAALGAATGYDPRRADALRLWVLGPSNEGKTTFLSSIPSNLILDFEDGARGIPKGRATYLKIKDYDHYVSVKKKLIDEAKSGKRYWKRITIDTVDEWIGMIINQLQREKGVEDITEFGQKGHGYNLITNRCWSDLAELEEAGYTWACSGHLRLKTETNPATQKERTVPRAAIFPMLAGKFTNQSDFRLTSYCIRDTVEKTQKKQITGGKIIEVPVGTETKYVYYIDSFTTASQEGKCRGVPTMDRKIEVPLINGWDTFVKEYDAAVEEAKKKYSK